jgi:fimbrial chaperone protein
MFGLRHRIAVFLGACLGSLVLNAAPAWASAFQVSPVRLPLTASKSNGILALRNQSPETLRFQVTGFAWSQSPSGEMLLAQTTDIVFFPTMLSLKPGEARNLRVGAAVAIGATEKTYRIFVEELPPIDDTGTVNAVRVLMKMGIPIFLEPSKPVATPSIDALAMQGQRLAFALRDTGNAHFFTKKVHVSALGDAGQSLFEQDLPAWYVLGGSSRDYTLDLPGSACKASRLQVRVETDGTTIESFLPTPNGACAR